MLLKEYAKNFCKWQHETKQKSYCVLAYIFFAKKMSEPVAEIRGWGGGEAPPVPSPGSATGNLFSKDSCSLILLKDHFLVSEP